VLYNPLNPPKYVTSWILSYIGITGNKKADQTAKSALIYSSLPISIRHCKTQLHRQEHSL